MFLEWKGIGMVINMKLMVEHEQNVLKAIHISGIWAIQVNKGF